MDQIPGNEVLSGVAEKPPEYIALTTDELEESLFPSLVLLNKTNQNLSTYYKYTHTHTRTNKYNNFKTTTYKYNITPN